MNVPRFIYMTDLIRIFRKAGVFEAQTTDEVSKWMGLWGRLGATGQKMAQNWLYTSPKESGQYTFLI